MTFTGSKNASFQNGLQSGDFRKRRLLAVYLKKDGRNGEKNDVIHQYALRILCKGSCGFLSSGENYSNTVKTAEKKKISVLKNFRKRVGRALDFAKER